MNAPGDNFRGLSEERIRSVLHPHPVHVDPGLLDPGFRLPLDGRARSAAVLVPLVCQDDDWHLLFTRRTDTVQDHKGQVAFPGGAAEPGDRDRAETALREAWEEIGLPPDKRADPRLYERLSNGLWLRGDASGCRCSLAFPIHALVKRSQPGVHDPAVPGWRTRPIMKKGITRSLEARSTGL